MTNLRADNDDDDADANRLRGIWEALVYLEQESAELAGKEVALLVGCARAVLEEEANGGAPPPLTGGPAAMH